MSPCQAAVRMPRPPGKSKRTDDNCLSLPVLPAGFHCGQPDPVLFHLLRALHPTEQKPMANRVPVPGRMAGLVSCQTHLPHPVCPVKTCGATQSGPICCVQRYNAASHCPARHSARSRLACSSCSEDSTWVASRVASSCASACPFVPPYLTPTWCQGLPETILKSTSSVQSNKITVWLFLGPAEGNTRLPGCH